LLELKILINFILKESYNEGKSEIWVYNKKDMRIF